MSGNADGSEAVGQALSEADGAQAARWILRAAAANGDGSPTDASAVITTRQPAVDLISGATVDSNQPVIVVVAHGHFDLRAFDKPPEATVSEQENDELVCVFDYSTGRGVAVTERRTSEQGELDLAELGPVTTLDLG